MNGNYKIKAEFIFTSNKKGTALYCKTVYDCDPMLNTECKKSGCYINGGECKQTTNIKYAKSFDIYE